MPFPNILTQRVLEGRASVGSGRRAAFTRPKPGGGHCHSTFCIVTFQVQLLGQPDYLNAHSSSISGLDNTSVSHSDQSQFDYVSLPYSRKKSYSNIFHLAMFIFKWLVSCEIKSTLKVYLLSHSLYAANSLLGF